MEDIAKLAIVVSSRGTNTSKKEIKQLKDEINKLKDSLKKKQKQEEDGTKSQNKFTTATTEFRSTLPQIASGLYLVQQAYGALSSAMEAVEQQYEEQYASEIKLEQILRATGNAVGYTTEQIYEMTDAWSEITGINDALLVDAAAIGATFTQISQEVFPDLIEQALNMSTIFRQDLKQSIIQLGVATNNLQVSRLTRIGISFTDQQKEQIRVLRQSGKVLEAQREIMAELEREIGGVAEVLGATSLGAIQRFQTAWENTMEELGEASTNFKAHMIQNLGLDDVLNEITDALAKNNAADEIQSYFEADKLSDPLVLLGFRREDLTNAKEIYLDEIERLEGQKSRFGILTPNKTKEENKENLDYYTSLYIAVNNATVAFDDLQAAREKEIEAEQAAKRAKQEADALALLAKEYEVYTKLKEKAELAGIDDKYERQRRALELEWLGIRKEAWEEHKLTIEQLNDLTGNYYDNMLAAITRAQMEESMLAQAKENTAEAEKLIDDALSGSFVTQQQYINIQNLLGEAYAKNIITFKQYTDALAEIDDKLEETLALPSWDQFWKEYVMGVGDAYDETEALINVLGVLGDSFQNLALDAVSETLASIGEGLAGNKDAFKDWGATMKSLIASTLEALGPQLMLAGTQMLIASGGTNPAGWALLAAGAGSTIFGGYLGFNADGSGSSDASGSSAAINTDIVDASDTFTSSGSRGLSTNVTSTVINNTGANVTTSENVTRDGQIILETVVDRAVQASGNTYGLQRAGVSVR